jgi:hypothetical protein
VRDQRIYRVVKPASVLSTFHTDYQLLDASDNAIFRICTHGVPLLGNEAAHIHNSRDERIEDGDGRLDRQTLVGADFLLFFKYVCSYLDGNKPLWL